MLTLKQWLEKYGSKPCDGCFYNIPHRAKCTYKKGYCVCYDEYNADQDIYDHNRVMPVWKENYD